MLPVDLSYMSTALTGGLGAAVGATMLFAIGLGRRRHVRRDSESRRLTDASAGNDIARELLIPVVQNDPDHVERATVINRISQLVVANDWETLSGQIAHWEVRLAETPGGIRKHELGIETCLTGLQTLLDAAPRTDIDALAMAEAEVGRFVARHQSDPNDHILAVLAARAHMAIGASCRAEFWPDGQSKAAWRRMAQHYVRAETILGPFDAVAYMSPLLGQAFYHLALGMPDGGKRLRPAFEDWIDLDPSNAAIYAVHAPMLLPRNFGSRTEILDEAEKARERTQETLGLGGYTLFCLPLLDEDDDIRALIEPTTFADGILDLASLSGTQAEVNWAAAVLMKERDANVGIRAEIFDRALHKLVRRHLGVIYPRFWHIDLADIRALLATIYAETLPPNAPGPLSSTLADRSPAAA